MFNLVQIIFVAKCDIFPEHFLFLKKHKITIFAQLFLFMSDIILKTNKLERHYSFVAIILSRLEGNGNHIRRLISFPNFTPETVSLEMKLG